jgi:hypothetical protein
MPLTKSYGTILSRNPTKLVWPDAEYEEIHSKNSIGTLSPGCIAVYSAAIHYLICKPLWLYNPRHFKYL